MTLVDIIIFTVTSMFVIVSMFYLYIFSGYVTLDLFGATLSQVNSLSVLPELT